MAIASLGQYVRPIALSSLAQLSAQSPLWYHCEAIRLADMVCSGVPHNQPDASRSFEEMVATRQAGYSDDLVLTLAKAGLLVDAASGLEARRLLELRAEIVRRVRPYVVNDSAQWGPRFAGAVLNELPITDNEHWASKGSGAIMALGGFANSTDQTIALLTATTHLNIEAISAAISLSYGMRSRRVGTALVEVMQHGADVGVAVAVQLHEELDVEVSSHRSISRALTVDDTADLVDDVSDFISARYVLSCGLRAALEATRYPDNEIRTAIELSGRTGDPDTAGVVAAGLLSASDPIRYHEQIIQLSRKHSLETFDQFWSNECKPLTIT